MTKRKPTRPPHVGAKRAAIYVRVSSERQADRVSPQAQEQDCRAYCEARGYAVAEAYRDVERYRVGRRLVEPSGSRADRPQLRRMLADAGGGRFEVIVAWREDRLYRSYRPMLDVLDCLEQTGAEIELVKETFDKKIAPVKAWAARMELDAKHERILMGVAGRFRKGKDWNSVPPYGYRRIDGVYEPEPAEAEWVRRIWVWFGEGASGREIRARLIAGGAPQRRGGKHVWAVALLYQLLHSDYYHTGRLVRRWDGETFELPIPALVDVETAHAVQARFARWKKYPAGHMKQHALAAGRVVCQACGAGMIVISQRGVGYYKCTRRFSVGEYGPGCAKSVKIDRLDAVIWRKLWGMFAEPGEFERLIQVRIAELQAQEMDAASEGERLQGQLDEVLTERQWVITQARKKTISEADMQMQLTALDFQQASLERALGEARLLAVGRSGQLLEVAQLYREKVLCGAGAISVEPQTPEQARLQFEARRKFVEGLVTQVEVDAGKTPHVHTELDWTPNPPAVPITLASANRR